MPTRLLHIDDETQLCRLVDTEEQSRPYFALSYCWGDQAGPTGTARLTKDTLPLWKQGCPVSEMPRLFRDACYLTLEFGGGYLWIDSLCILQDDNRDKMKEVSRMGDIYHNAECTIVNSSPQAPLWVAKTGLLQPLRNRRWTVAPYTILDTRSDPHARSSRTRLCMFQEPILPIRTLEIDSFKRVHTINDSDFQRDAVDPGDCVNVTLDQWTELIKTLAKTGNDEDNIVKDQGNTTENATRSSTGTPEDVPEQQSVLEDMDTKNDMPHANVEIIDFKPLEQSHGEETVETDNDLSKVRMEIINSKPLNNPHQPQRSFDVAIKIAREGIDYCKTKQPLQATTKFVKARDYISAFMTPSVESLHGHLLFSTYLTLAYLCQQIPDVALDVIADAKTLLEKHAILACQLPPIMYVRSNILKVSTNISSTGRFNLALGDAHLALDNSSSAQHAYEQAIEQFRKDSECQDFLAIAQLKISDTYISCGRFEEAQ